jgi:hypothetical protein
MTISATSSRALTKWGLTNKVHVCLRDNGKNIVAVTEVSSTGDVIPMVIGIRRSLQLVTEDAGVKTMKPDIVDDISNRFVDVMREPMYMVVMLHGRSSLPR